MMIENDTEDRTEHKNLFMKFAELDRKLYKKTYEALSDE
jgi:hypothetical protein